MRYFRSITTSLLLAGLLSVAGAQTQTMEPKGGLFDALAGPGGYVRLTTNPHKDGPAGTVRARNSAEGEFLRFTASGRIDLDSTKLKLNADMLDFDGPGQMLTATGEVVVKQEGLEAYCEKLVYNLKDETIVMSGKPRVLQQAEGNRTEFSGMEQFRLITLPNGETEARMEGGERIDVKIRQDAPAAGVPAATPAPKTGPPKGSSMNALGNNVDISVAPRGNVSPGIVTSASESALQTFRATGSVKVKTEDLDLRCDQLELRGAENILEALHNVYFKQEGIDADCGKMLYDLNTDIITLLVNPVVRQASAKGLTVIRDMDSFIIERQADGSITTDIVGGSSRIDIVSNDAAPTVAAPAGPTGPTEIDLDRKDRKLPAIP